MFFESHVFIVLKGLFCNENVSKYFFFGVIYIKRKVNKTSNFSPKPWTNSFGTMRIFLRFWKRCFHSQEMLVCYIKRRKSFFHDLFSYLLYGDTWRYRGLQGVTWGYKGLQRVTRGYRGLQGVTGGFEVLQEITGGYRGLQRVTWGYKGLHWVTKGYKKLQGVTGGYKGLQELTKDYRNLFFLLERRYILFLCLFFIKIKVKKISNF